MTNMLDVISDIFLYMKPHFVQDHLEIDHVADLTLYPICSVPVLEERVRTQRLLPLLQGRWLRAGRVRRGIPRRRWRADYGISSWGRTCRSRSSSAATERYTQYGL